MISDVIFEDSDDLFFSIDIRSSSSSSSSVSSSSTSSSSSSST